MQAFTRRCGQPEVAHRKHSKRESCDSGWERHVSRQSNVLCSAPHRCWWTAGDIQGSLIKTSLCTIFSVKLTVFCLVFLLDRQSGSSAWHGWHSCHSKRLQRLRFRFRSFRRRPTCSWLVERFENPHEIFSSVYHVKWSSFSLWQWKHKNLENTDRFYGNFNWTRAKRFRFWGLFK